jgi:dTMP kinase
MTGKFISLEGPEGAGKSTLAAALKQRLEEKGVSVVLTREPGDGPVGGAIRDILLHGRVEDPLTELFLFLADRCQHVLHVIRPALAAGKLVLSDRYGDSTVVYQGHAGGIDPGTLRVWNDIATDRLIPDLTLLLDLDPEQGLARLASPDRIDAKPLEFHRRVREGFLLEAQRDPGRWLILDATLSPGAVLDQALLRIESANFFQKTV